MSKHTGSNCSFIVIKTKLQLYKAAEKVTTSARDEICKLKKAELKQQFMIELSEQMMTKTQTIDGGYNETS